MPSEGEVQGDEKVRKRHKDPTSENAQARAGTDGRINAEADDCGRRGGCATYKDVRTYQDATPREKSKFHDVPMPRGAARYSAGYRHGCGTTATIPTNYNNGTPRHDDFEQNSMSCLCEC